MRLPSYQKRQTCRCDVRATQNGRHDMFTGSSSSRSWHANATCLRSLITGWDDRPNMIVSKNTKDKICVVKLTVTTVRLV